MRSLLGQDTAAEAAPAPAAGGGWAGMAGTAKLGLLGVAVLGVVGVIVLPDLGGSDKPAAKPQNQDTSSASAVNDYTPPPPESGFQNAAANMGEAGHPPPPHVRRRPVPTPMALYAAPNVPAAPTASPQPPQAAPASATASAAPGVPTVAMTGGEGTARVVPLVHRSYTIREGSSLPCLSVEANDSSRPGYVTCRVQGWVRGDDQRRGLLPPGTPIVGQIREGLQRFQRRLGVVYTKIEAPWFTVTFPGVGADAMGRAGEDADVRTFFWDRAGAVALYALMDTAIGAGQAAGTAALSRAVTGGNGTVLDFGSLGGQAQGLASQEMQSRINQPPIATRDQALPLTVQVGQDIDLYDACRRAMQVDPMACPLVE